jgi:diaminopimelate decarboxylase
MTTTPGEMLEEIVRRFGTPTFAYDLGKIRAQIGKLRATLPSAVEIYYSLKANASLGLCAFIAQEGPGADVASAGELITAIEAAFPPARILVTGPDKSDPVVQMLSLVPNGIVSLDSVSELERLATLGQGQRALLRLRPDFCSFAQCSAGPGSRFGLRLEDVPLCRPYLRATGLRVVGFHVFSGSQVQDAEAVNHHLRGGLDLALRAASLLDLTPEIIDLGGGFGIPYGPEDPELDLTAVSAELDRLVHQAAPARLLVELGRYIVGQAGWYLTSVLAHQNHGGRPAVVVDGGCHQRGDLCGLNLRKKAFAPVVLPFRRATRRPTDVLGCLSLPGDVLAEDRLLPELTLGDVLAFPNAGAYGLGASPHAFHAHLAPTEVAFEKDQIHVLRPRQTVRSILDGQTRALVRPAHTRP